AAAAADIRRSALHVRASAPCEAESQRKIDFVPREFALVGSPRHNTGRLLTFRSFFRPGDSLTAQQKKPRLDRVGQKARLHPLDFESRFFVAVLNPNYFADFEGMLHTRELSAFATQV